MVKVVAGFDRPVHDDETGYRNDWNLTPGFQRAREPREVPATPLAPERRCCFHGPVSVISTGWMPIVMLFVSNLFMTVAWYGHLKHRDAPLARVILASWGIAFFEYVIMVPANRWGSAIYSPYQLKILQEVITLVVFSGFALLYFGTRPQWNHLAAFGCIIGAVVFTFLPGSSGR